MKEEFDQVTNDAIKEEVADNADFEDAKVYDEVASAEDDDSLQRPKDILTYDEVVFPEDDWLGESQEDDSEAIVDLRNANEESLKTESDRILEVVMETVMAQINPDAAAATAGSEDGEDKKNSLI